MRFSIVTSRVWAFLSRHSQIVITVHPDLRKALTCFLSLVTLSAIFFIQNDSFVLGSLARLQFLC